MKGGKRKGAGRPIGSKTKPQILDYITEKEVLELVKIVKEKALVDPVILKFIVEQVFGKARQPIEGTGENGEFVAKVIILPERKNE